VTVRVPNRTITAQISLAQQQWVGEADDEAGETMAYISKVCTQYSSDQILCGVFDRNTVVLTQSNVASITFQLDVTSRRRLYAQASALVFIHN
jgi:hypothetical protein